MFIFLNLFLTVVLTWFTIAVYPVIPATGLNALLIFAGWSLIFWLLSFFYHKKSFYKTPQIAALIVFYLKELVIASIRVAYDVVTPKVFMQPAVVAVPLDAKTNLEITLLANFITLTPGTLSIDVSEDRKTLYIHEVYVKKGDIDAFKNQIKNGFEKRILKITR